MPSTKPRLWLSSASSRHRVAVASAPARVNQRSAWVWASASAGQAAIAKKAAFALRYPSGYCSVPSPSR